MHTQRLIQMLLDAGHEVVEVDSRNPFPLGMDRYKYIRYPAFARVKKIRPMWLQAWLRGLIAVVGLWLIELWVKPDVTHILSIGDSSYRCVMAGIKPLILTAWGADINNLFPLENQDPAYLKKISMALKRSDCVTGDTVQLLERCEVIAGEKLNKSLFYFGVDLHLFKEQEPQIIKALRESIGITENSKIVLSIRKFNASMNHNLILQAFASASKNCDVDAVLLFRRIFINSDDFEEAIHKLGAELGIEKRLFWVDQMAYEMLPALYQMADVIVNFPDNDGFPVSLLEAACSKTLIITSDLEDYREILDQGSFLRVPTGNVSALSEILTSVFKDEIQDRESLINNNFELISRIGSLERSLKDVESIYSQVRIN